MKKVLFASTALAALAVGGVASAQGIALFGDARLGLGYNINNDGSVNGDEDLHAVSRVRFGVNMTGETDSGISFGATIRADNASGGQGGTSGQSAGEVFVSGSWGTLTLGDTAGADEHWVGDVPGNFALTGFNDVQETLFISNGGSVGDSPSNPEARPTVRYDIDVAGFGLSLSSNRDLEDITVGAGYSADFAGGTWSLGLGYNDYTDFTLPGDTTLVVVNNQVVEVTGPGVSVGGGKQMSAGLNGEFEQFAFGVVYTKNDGDDGDDFDTLSVGGSYGFDAFTVGAFYHTFLKGDGIYDTVDGDDAYGLTAKYDLGGGATVNGGVGRGWGGDGDDNDARTVADFGIKMAF